jgi:DNA ligase (NAD+)
MAKSLFDTEDTFIGITDASFESRLKKMSLKEKETLYLKAKDRYYSGDPIMSDPQFDRLELWLESEDSKVTQKVGGADGDRDKLIHPHMSPMLSLEKIQVNDEDNFPLAEIQSWNATHTYPLEATPKFDGNAIELQYRGGKLKLAITRGEHGKGGDVTKKLLTMGIPEQLPVDKDIEIRGEVCMPMTIFKNKYQKDFKNPRNLVAGILNPNNDKDERSSDCAFVAYSVKVHQNGRVHYVEDAMANLERFGFNKDYPVRVETIQNAQDYRRVYDIFKHYREVQSPFQLDGIVFKTPENKRAAIGENSRHPKWAIALKFPAKEVTTKIISHVWEVGYTGELSPVGILEPVDLDGSEITRVSLYNKSRIIASGTFPGAVVTIRKAGDIIPQIIKIVQPSPDSAKYIRDKNFFPTCCPACGGNIDVEVYSTNKKNDAPTEHLMCNNPDCSGKLTRKLSLGISALKVKGIGDSTCEGLIKSGVKTIFDVFDATKFNTQALCKAGVFKPGRQLELVLNAIKAIKQVDLDKAILALQFDGLGDTGSKAVADLVAGRIQNFDNMGLEKAVVDPFLNANSWQSQSIKSFLGVLKDNGITVNMPKQIAAGAIVFEMTGSPESAGYKTKEEFVNYVARYGYVHGKLAKASLLITDSYTSKTSKMKDAEKKGIKIMTYEDLINSL